VSKKLDFIHVLGRIQSKQVLLKHMPQKMLPSLWCCLLSYYIWL